MHSFIHSFIHAFFSTNASERERDTFSSSAFFSRGHFKQGDKGTRGRTDGRTDGHQTARGGRDVRPINEFIYSEKSGGFISNLIYIELLFEKWYIGSDPTDRPTRDPTDPTVRAVARFAWLGVACVR